MKKKELLWTGSQCYVNPSSHGSFADVECACRSRVRKLRFAYRAPSGQQSLPGPLNRKRLRLVPAHPTQVRSPYRYTHKRRLPEQKFGLGTLHATIARADARFPRDPSIKCQSSVSVVPSSFLYFQVPAPPVGYKITLRKGEDEVNAKVTHYIAVQIVE
jgi:hypothetical protein